jgi:hypothetical protein
MVGKGHKFTAKGERALEHIEASAKKYHRDLNPYAIVSARVPGSRYKRKKKR